MAPPVSKPLRAAGLDVAGRAGQNVANRLEIPMADAPPASEDTILPGEPPVRIRVRRSAQARRMSLRVSSVDGRVTLSLPKRARLAEALAFAREREEWIRAALCRGHAPVQIAPGVRLPLEGSLVPVVQAPVPRVVGTDAALLVPPGEARFAARTLSYLKRLALLRLENSCRRHAEALGHSYAAIALRDPRSRWGSCSSDGRLMFSWRLILAPPPVLDYVAAHEVAHLVHMDHSAAFWSVVARLCPDHRRHRQWLAEEGASLHRWRFAPPPPVSAGPAATAPRAR